MLLSFENKLILTYAMKLTFQEQLDLNLYVFNLIACTKGYQISVCVFFFFFFFCIASISFVACPPRDMKRILEVMIYI